MNLSKRVNRDMITQMVYNQYKRMWKCHPWNRIQTYPHMGIDDPKLLAIAEYENAHRNTIDASERFLDDSEIEALLNADKDQKDGCVRCWVGPAYSGDTPCRDDKACNCAVPDLDYVPEGANCNDATGSYCCKI